MNNYELKEYKKKLERKEHKYKLKPFKPLKITIHMLLMSITIFMNGVDHTRSDFIVRSERNQS